MGVVNEDGNVERNRCDEHERDRYNPQHTARPAMHNYQIKSTERNIL